jgi:hemerythrin superfamily protein
MDAITLLTADHNRVRGMFARFKEAHEAEDTTTMIEVAGKVFDELKVHTTIEEEIFYPAVKEGTSELSEVVDEGIEEHHVVDHLMEELGQIEAGGDEWTAKMMVLIENVEHHAQEEEKEMFPQVRSTFGEQVNKDLATQLESRKKQLGAPVLQDKIDLTQQELMSLAQEQQIPGRSKMDHEELAATVAPA